MKDDFKFLVGYLYGDIHQEVGNVGSEQRQNVWAQEVDLKRTYLRGKVRPINIDYVNKEERREKEQVTTFKLNLLG